MRHGLWTVEEIAGLLPPETEMGRRFAEPLNRGTLRLGFYAPRGHDPQQPHDQDELYFVHRGSGTFVCDGEARAFKAGDALFVAAEVEHRFEDFSDDFSAWVVFWGAKGGEEPE